MLVLRLSRKIHVPMFRQICRGVADLIDNGTLAPGDRLPPTRVLARTAGVHRSTVVEAYAELRALGYLDSRQGSYSTVRARAPLASARKLAAAQPTPCLIDWPARSTPGAAAALVERTAQHPMSRARQGAIDFMSLRPDPRLAPCQELIRRIRKLLSTSGGQAVDYGDPAGHPELRNQLAARLRTHGVEVSAEDIVVTAGAQQGMDLILRMLTRPGDQVLVESPTYARALSLLALHRLVAAPVPMGPEGMELDELDRQLRKSRVKLVYTMPNFQNPTGLTTSQPHRERLLSLCEARRVPVLEDGFEEDMKYFGQAVLPIKSMDTRGIVLYLGTLSKVVFPGLRVGWIAAPAGAAERLAAIQAAACLGGNTLTQAAVAALYSTGDHEAYLRRLHRVYRKRMHAMLQGLDEHLAQKIQFTRPAGGCTLLLTLPHRANRERALCARLAQGGVLVSEGAPCFVRPPAKAHVRLSIATVDEEQIRQGCQKLGRLLA